MPNDAAAPTRALRRWSVVAGGLALTVAVAVLGWGAVRPAPTVAVRPGPSPSPTAVASPVASPEASASASAGVTGAGSAAAGALTGDTLRPPAAPSAQDRLAGLRSRTVPEVGTGRLVVVPGSQAAPGRGTVHRVRVEVEGGLDVDPAAFAAFVLATLNDPRSWGRGGTATFARTDGAADIRVVLASPRTSARLCRPLQTRGTLSCGMGDHAILTYYRWVRGTPDYAADLTAYRRYLVNHEVGHVLGHGHVACPGRGRPAPVMMQQTKGLAGCTANAWPYP